MARTLVIVPLASLISTIFGIMQCHSIFFILKINILNFYYQFTTFESENMRNYNNLCKILEK